MDSGDTIGKYRVIRRLGRGGMGEVWLATALGHGGFAKNVVLKTLLPELATDPMFIEMLANEARIGAKLSHPNLIEVFDFIEQGGRYLLAMEYVVGRPLHHVLQALKDRRQQVPLGLALRIAVDCCRGLQYAHDQGIIHCDLSPSNVMITAAGITKILDFGVAHAASRGPRSDRLKGKFSYMAPERIESLATDRRTDVYSLGVMLYLMLTGRLPYTAEAEPELLRRILAGSPVPPSRLCEIDPRVEQVVLRAMQPDPGARHQHVGEVLAALVPCAEQLGGFDQQATVVYLDRLFGVRASTEDEVTAEASAHELDSFDIDIESDLELPHVRRSSGSSERYGQILPSAMFARGSETCETRTSVQTLFDRPVLAGSKAFEPSATIWGLRTERSEAGEGGQGWFARDVDRGQLDPGTPRTPPADEPATAWDRLARARASRARDVGPPSETDEPAWPWPCSRVK